jgi:multiple sugar transport system substrate-binding protein
MAAAAVPALAACGESAGAARTSVESTPRPGQKVDLTFWTWVPLQKAAALWNKLNPDIQVHVQIVPAGTSGGYAKMHAALKAGNAPDLAQVEYGNLPEFMLDNGLTELDQYGAGRLKAAYAPWQWNQGVFAGKVYALPQASGPMGYFYRKDLFDRWDLEVPRTWDEFRQAAVKVKKRGGGSRLSSFSPDGGYFAAFPWQRGAHWIRTDPRDDTWIVGIDSKESLEVADFWDGLIRDDLVTVMPSLAPAWFHAMEAGDIASWPGAQWCDALLRGNLPRNKGKWRVAGMPQWEAGGTASSNYGGSSVAILQGTRHPVEAMKFAHWLNTDLRSIDLLVAAGYGWPAVASIDLKKTALGKPDPFFGNQIYNEVFQASDREVDTSWQWAPTSTQSIGHITDAIGRELNTGGSLVSALKDSQPRVVDDLKAKGLKARAA